MQPLTSEDPAVVGGYRLHGRLGAGGMAQVFLGASPGGRKVAVKLVRPEYADDAEFRRRFAREVAAARQVGGFHTAAVVDADPDADPPWMATAYIPGPSLAEAIAQRLGTTPERDPYPGLLASIATGVFRSSMSFWASSGGTVPLEHLVDQAFAALASGLQAPRKENP